MRYYIFTFLLLFTATTCFAQSKAKKVKVTKKELAAQEDAFRKGSGTVYVFGVSQQLTDSLVYITNIQQVDSIDLAKRTKFLPMRSEFSLQVKEYLEREIKQNKQTSCVFFSNNRKKLSKQYYKIKKRYLDNPDTRLIIIEDEKFQFKHPFDTYATE